MPSGIGGTLMSGSVDVLLDALKESLPDDAELDDDEDGGGSSLPEAAVWLAEGRVLRGSGVSHDEGDSWSIAWSCDGSW